MLRTRLAIMIPALLSAALCSASASAAAAVGAAERQWFLASIDGKAQLVNGKPAIVPGADTLALIEITASGARVVQQLPVPNSAMGPAQSVVVSPDATLALVTQRAARDPADPAKSIAGDLVSVVDLSGHTMRLTQTVHAGMGASGLAISPDGKLALVTGSADGTLTVFRIAAGQLQQVARLALPAASQPAQAAFTTDGKHALVTRNGDNRITWLNVDGEQVTLAGHDMMAGLRPNAMAVGAGGDYAVEADIGSHTGDSNTVSLIDLRGALPQVVDSVSVGMGPEDVVFAPDGRHIGAVVQRGSETAPGSRLYQQHGRFVLLRVDGGKLHQVSEVAIGGWSQGGVFSADGKTVLVENGIEQNIQVFKVEGDHVRDTGQVLPFAGVPGGLAAFSTR